MKKKQLYAAPEVQVHQVLLEVGMLTTSNSDFDGNIDDGVEEIWSDLLSSPNFIF